MSDTLERLLFMEGEWVGEGNEGDKRLRCTASGRVLVPNAWFQVTENFEWVDSGERLQDVSLYRYDASRLGYSVMHLKPEGRVDEYPIVLEADGVRWYLGPEGPEVVFRGTDAGWSARVGPADSPTIKLDYRRATT